MKTARVFKNGQSQAVRLPKEFRFKDDLVYVMKTGNIVNLIPVSGYWQTLVDSLSRFTDDFMEDRAQPREQTREDIG